MRPPQGAKFIFEKKKRCDYLKGIFERLVNDVGAFHALFVEYNSKNRNNAVGFWAGIRLIVPIIETIALINNEQPPEFMKKHLNMPASYLVWNLFRHSLIHGDTIHFAQFDKNRVNWGSSIGDGEHIFSSNFIQINSTYLYKQVKEYLEKEILKNDQNEIDMEVGEDYSLAKSKREILDALVELGYERKLLDSVKLNEIDVGLKKINEQTIDLFHHLDLFNKVDDIMVQNKQFENMDTTVPLLMRFNFIVDLVMGIGRLCDRDHRTESLVRFLDSLRGSEEYLKRERFLGLYTKPTETKESEKAYWVERANKDFDKLAGIGSNSYPTSKIDEDIEKLTNQDPCKKIKGYRDQYIAHLDQNPQSVPTYGDLRASFNVIDEIVKKYNLLLTANAMSLTPVMQGNWHEVFTIPWLAPGQTLPSNKTSDVPL